MNVFEYGNPDAPVVLIQPVDDHNLGGIENETVEISKLTDIDYHLIAVKVGSWNKDLSPWEAPPVFGKEGFGSGASAFLTEILTLTKDSGRTYYIGGYSLAGLFALWTAYQTNVFQGVASASPSLWFPGFVDYMKQHDIKSKAVYLSLGDMEDKARNPVMADVADRIRNAYGLLKAQWCDCILEWNPGNHFRDADIRTAKAFAWVMNKTVIK